MEEKSNEKTKRFDMVWGIIVASILGVILNLLANLYYDLFIVKTIVWGKVDHFQVLCITLLLIALVGFLQFFISDYKNEAGLNKNLLKRFRQYFFYEYTPGKYMRVFFGIYMLLILVSVLGGIHYLVALQIGYLYAAISFILMFFLTYYKEKVSNRTKVK